MNPGRKRKEKHAPVDFICSERSRQINTGYLGAERLLRVKIKKERNLGGREVFIVDIGTRVTGLAPI